jgi:hypothetical protein
MNIIKQAVSVFIFLFTVSCDLNQDYFSNSVDDDLEKALINEIVDSWHLAASKADSVLTLTSLQMTIAFFKGLMIMRDGPKPNSKIGVANISKENLLGLLCLRKGEILE